MIPANSSVALLLLLALGASASNSGRPLCRQPQDFIRDFAVKNDPNRFWKCAAFGVAAVQDCPEGRTFSELHGMCTIPEAPIVDIDLPTKLIECGEGEEIDLSGVPFCTPLSCDNGLIYYDPEGHPGCHRDASHVQLCPGVAEEKRVLGTESCARPQCDSAQYQSNKFFPSANPTEFYRCAHINTPVIFKCQPGLCYDAKSQGCAWPATWNNVCA